MCADSGRLARIQDDLRGIHPSACFRSAPIPLRSAVIFAAAPGGVSVHAGSPVRTVYLSARYSCVFVCVLYACVFVFACMYVCFFSCWLVSELRTTNLLLFVALLPCVGGGVALINGTVVPSRHELKKTKTVMILLSDRTGSDRTGLPTPSPTRSKKHTGPVFGLLLLLYNSATFLLRKISVFLFSFLYAKK